MATFTIEDTSSNAETAQEFLRESNLIEREGSEEAFEDACKAWDYALTIEKEDMDVEKILEIHRILMARINPEIAGKMRKCNVWIGGKMKRFIDTQLLTWELESVLDSIQHSFKCKTQIPFLLAARSHIAFEACHPFEDGNGRTGRILYNWHRLKLRLPIHIIHVGSEQRSYYDWFTDGI